MSYEDLTTAAAVIAERSGREQHATAVVLGSGLSSFAAGLPDAIEIPDVVNRSEADALRILEQAGFTNIDVDTAPSGEIDEGRVIETEPPIGTLLAPEDLLKLIVSEGAVPTVVPSVVGDEPEVVWVADNGESTRYASFERFLRDHLAALRRRISAARNTTRPKAKAKKASAKKTAGKKATAKKGK